MYQELYRTCTSIVLLIKPLVSDVPFAVAVVVRRPYDSSNELDTNSFGYYFTWNALSTLTYFVIDTSVISVGF